MTNNYRSGWDLNKREGLTLEHNESIERPTDLPRGPLSATPPPWAGSATLYLYVTCTYGSVLFTPPCMHPNQHCRFKKDSCREAPHQHTQYAYVHLYKRMGGMNRMLSVNHDETG